MSDEDGRFWMVFNGEIYNSPELRRYCEAKGHKFRSGSDGEVILHLWEMEGWKSLGRLNGIFAVAIGDEKTGNVFLARDPLGVKPLFYTPSGETLLFASELQALANEGGQLGRLDPVALAQFLTFLWIPGPRTPFANVHALAPGHVLEWRSGRARLHRYADLLGEAASQPTLAVPTPGEVKERVRSAVQRQLLSDVPIGLLASGGVDSSLIWWGAEGAVARAFTIDWSTHEGDERNNEDAEAVRMLERQFGTPVDYLPGEATEIGVLPSSGDLFADPAVELTRRIASRAHDLGFKVLLSGQGGDELFGGYRRHQIASVVGRLRTGRLGSRIARALAAAAPNDIRVEYVARLARASARRDPLESYLELCSYSTAADRARALDCSTAEVSDDVVWQCHRDVFEHLPTTWSLARRMRAVDVAVYLPGLGLAYADRAGMQHSVEIRVPWLDLELTRWALCLPDSAMIRGRQSKWLTRRLAADVLPPHISTRPKRGFGVPASLMPRTARGTSDRGFRQSAYFGLARRLVTEFEAKIAVSG